MVKIGEEEIENGKHLLKNVFHIGSDLSYLSTINDCIVYHCAGRDRHGTIGIDACIIGMSICKNI